MVRLALTVAPDLPILVQLDDCDWPEKEPYIDRIVAAHGWIVHKVRPEFSVWELARTMKLGDVEICSQSHRLTREAFLEPLDAKRRELERDGVFMGLRREESAARRHTLDSRGPLYRLRNGVWHCSPLWDWRTEDVFAFLVSNDLEINPCYFHNRFLSPEDIRLSWALPTPIGLSMGTMEHIRHYYPAQFRRLRELGVIS
jgi:3'-phosphoadenosine 5'-phosphosulfate sulfotransferase (PAPS reductase)/FAD synthetase